MSSKPLNGKPANNCANPFLSRSLFNLPLHLELAQEIHFAALHRAVFQPDTAPAPASIISDQFRQQVARWGAEMCLVHPTHVAEVFTGVTTTVYQAIEQFYCDTLRRSPTIVYHLLARMAQQVGRPPPHVEAVWAICTYLYQKHQDKAASVCRPTGQVWHILTLTPDIWLRDHSGDIFQPEVICILNLAGRQVLTFSISQRGANPDSARRIALYQAIVAERTPGVLMPGGLIWHLPRAVVPDTDLAPESRQQLEQLGVRVVRPRQINTETTAVLYDNWAADLRRYPHIWYDHFVRVFDNFLEKTLGYSPGSISIWGRDVRK